MTRTIKFAEVTAIKNTIHPEGSITAEIIKLNIPQEETTKKNDELIYKLTRGLTVVDIKYYTELTKMSTDTWLKNSEVVEGTRKYLEESSKEVGV